MLHKGNISNIHICPEDVVDCVVGGSPCQDLSVAGLRKGIKHESKGDEETTRSGLFMEQIRIIKEMRDVDKRAGRAGVDIRPRWAVWENVPGALSSGKPKGEDFRIVLEEFAKIADTAVTIPGPPRGGGGSLLGALWETGSLLPGASWTPVTTEYHNAVEELLLSAILLLTAPLRYCLTKKACAGILRRAKGRGKELPLILRDALLEVTGPDWEAIEA